MKLIVKQVGEKIVLVKQKYLNDIQVQNLISTLCSYRFNIDSRERKKKKDIKK